MKLNEKSMFRYRSVPNIIKILIRDDEVNAKDFLRGQGLDKDVIAF